MADAIVTPQSVAALEQQHQVLLSDGLVHVLHTVDVHQAGRSTMVCGKTVRWWEPTITHYQDVSCLACAAHQVEEALRRG